MVVRRGGLDSGQVLHYGAVLEHAVRLLVVVRGKYPSFRSLDDAALRGQVAHGRKRRDVAQARRRQELGLKPEGDIAKAVEAEDYEMASRIRDEIRSRKDNDSGTSVQKLK